MCILYKDLRIDLCSSAEQQRRSKMMQSQGVLVRWVFQLAVRLCVQRGVCGIRVGRVVLTVLWCASLWYSSVAFAGPPGKGWQDDYQTAKAHAQEKNVPLVIHFYADWCGPCRAMDSDVLGSPEVTAAITTGIIGVKVNSDLHRDLVAQFGVSALPTDVIVSPDGQVLSKSVGSPGRSGYLAKLMQFRRIEEETPSDETRSGSPKLPTAVAEASSSAKAATPGESRPASPEPQTAASGMSEAEVAVSSASPSSKAIVGRTVSNSARQEDSDDKTAGSAIPNMRVTLRRDGKHRIGLSGYSPVSLSDSAEWTTGAPEFQHEFEGVSYHLSNAEELARFKAHPEQFIPALHGCDPVALVKNQIIQSGHLELGVTYRSRIYFFATQSSRDEFLRNPDKFSETHSIAFFHSEDGSDS
jgi:YHS domain-containing protein/thiol-disulfide isomerase/thioredoxin